MKRAKRSSAKGSNGQGNAGDHAAAHDLNFNEVFVISDSTHSSEKGSDADELSDSRSSEKEAGERGSGMTRGRRGRGRGKGKASASRAERSLALNARKEGASKPETPETSFGKRRRSAAFLGESEDSSGSEFIPPSESEDDMDSEFSGVMTGDRKRRGAAEFLESEPEREASPVRRGGGGRQAQRARRRGASANGSNRKKKGKAKGHFDQEKLRWEISDDEWEETWKDASDADFEAIKVSKLPLEQRDPPKELLMPLLPFQKEWLAWSLKQEAGPLKGGILADEMGMGKTIQAISLIVAGRAAAQSPSNLDPNPSSGSSSKVAQHLSASAKVLPQVKGTLVICPLVAVIQWRNEVARFTESGSVKVLVYHGPRRSLGLAELSEYDIVLTTYSIVEVEHRKHVMPPKDVCQWCRRQFYPDRMRIHQRYYCGPHAQKTEKQAKQQVKRKFVATPLPSQDDHEEEKGVTSEEVSEEDLKANKGKGKGKGAKKPRVSASKPANGQMKGVKRKVGQEDLSQALEGATDFVDGLAMASSKGNSVLHSVRWGRVILDEAHSIKDRRCSTAKAVFALQSEYKWALSGTPLQNRVGELYSLVRFLGIHPFSFYFCRKCECKSLEYQFASPGEKCDCGHSPLLHFCWWNKFVANPIKRWGYILEGRRAMMLLKHKVLDNILLRRTKLERAADLALPPRTAFLRRDAFDCRESDFYQALYTQSQSQFNTYVTAGTLVNNYAHIFDLLTRLRQAVDHPYLVIYSATVCKDSPAFETAAAGDCCGLCHESAEDPLTTGCLHNFCRACIQNFIDAAQGLTSQCPTCQKPLTVDLTGKIDIEKDSGAKRQYKRSSILNRINLHQFQTSTKIEAVREEVYNMLDKDPAAKAIIFSQFTSMLDLIGFGLQKVWLCRSDYFYYPPPSSGIKFVKLDGSMSMSARDQMIETFTTDADTKIFLMSLKAGGIALNLTVASHVFLMDPWWNPAVEQQAQDRIHRLGQFKPIRVIRFVIENTIEERILKLQEKKQLVFEGTVGGSSEALGRLTEEDLRFLFNS